MVSIKTFRRQQNTFYKSIVSVFCPLINETVYFTSDGFHHLIFKSNRKWRNINEQYLKLKCLTQAPDIIKNCTRILEIRKEMFTIKGKQKPVVTYELICDNKKYRSVAVIVTKIGTGKHRFRSVKRVSRRYLANKKAPKGA